MSGRTKVLGLLAVVGIGVFNGYYAFNGPLKDDRQEKLAEEARGGSAAEAVAARIAEETQPVPLKDKLKRKPAQGDEPVKDSALIHGASSKGSSWWSSITTPGDARTTEADESVRKN